VATGQALLHLLRPIPRTLAHTASVLILLGWAAQMGLLVKRAYLESPALAADLSRYGAGAQWKGVYYRGEKIGYSVGQTQATADGFELHEDGRLQMLLLGSSSAAQLRTVARVDKGFNLRSFDFALDPGTGPIEIRGALEGLRLDLTIKTPTGTRSESRTLTEPPSLALNLPRRLAAEGLEPGQHRRVSAFDPATLKNAPMELSVEGREVVWAAGRPVPAFRVKMTFSGLTTTSWITEVGEVVREESPMGLIVIRETRERATALAVPGDIQVDMLRTAAIQPKGPRIDDGVNVERLRLRLEGGDFAATELQGAGQTVTGSVFEIRDRATLTPETAPPNVARFLLPEPFIESDAPEIRAEAKKAVGDESDPRKRAEKLTRHVGALLEKKPTLSLPSALEVLRTRVGDCNEHTALYVALARAAGLPARVVVGLVHIHGAFYYHAWPEVFIEGPPGRGFWLPVDPTLNQFPADVTHVALGRGGLERQAAILPILGRAQITILDLQKRAGTTPILVGRPTRDNRPIEIALPSRDGALSCWSRPPE
jgi:transglutaminase-like putative cysteine protease